MGIKVKVIDDFNVEGNADEGLEEFSSTVNIVDIKIALCPRENGFIYTKYVILYTEKEIIIPEVFKYE